MHPCNIILLLFSLGVATGLSLLLISNCVYLRGSCKTGISSQNQNDTLKWSERLANLPVDIYRLKTAMYSHCAGRFPITIILLLATSFQSSFSQNSTDSEIQQRTIYVAPEDSCPVDHCYRLEDVLSNSSYFFDSYTTLELLPGEYNITEKVDQLVLIKVKNFTLKGSSPNVTIICQPGATWGLTIIKSLWVEISNVQIYS